MNNNTNPSNVPYLITSRDFPKDPEQLTQSLNRAYLDTANAVNARTVGLYSTGHQNITGEQWFLTNGRKYQTIRQVYQFMSTAAIPTNINLGTFGGFTEMYGNYTDGTNWYPLIGSSSTSITDQISFYVAANGSITFVVDGGGGTPSLTKGIIILAWLTPV